MTAGAPPPRRNADETGQRARILEAAREIIRETGNTDLPMRALSARARVSMTLPYALFGSKSGLVAAILAMDEPVFARQRASLQSVDAIEQHFDSLRLGMDFYAADQAFYRALFRMTWDTARGGQDPTRLNHAVFRTRMQEARAGGLLRENIDPDLFAEVLTDLFSSGVRAWAMLNWDVKRLHAKLGYGYASAFAGVGSAEVAQRMMARALGFQAQLQQWREDKGRSSPHAVAVE